MTFKHFFIGLLTVCVAVQTVFAQKQKNTPEVDVTVFESVLTTAGWANFKYLEQLDLAKKGDYKATLKLLEFSGTVDGVAALDHSVTLLELIAFGGEIPFAGALSLTKPKLKSTLLDRLQLAQGRTKKEALRKPMAEWAPTTWEVLQGKPFNPKVESTEDKSSKGRPTPSILEQNSIFSEPSESQSTIQSPQAPAVQKPKSKQ